MGDILWGPRKGAWAALSLLDRVLTRAKEQRFVSARRFNVVYSVGALLKPVTWQERLTGVECLGQSAAADAAVALASALDFALQPWLSGSSGLNVAELLRLAAPRLTHADGSSYPRPTTVFRSLESLNELFGEPLERIDLTKYVGEA